MNQKKQVGYEAAKLVENGMVVGLGTGSTAKYLVEALSERMQKENLFFTGVTTSTRTAEQAKKSGISMKTIDDVDSIDIAIDGADEFSLDNVAIKGGGGSLLYEKIVATYSKEFVLIMDETKVVDSVGAYPLAIEVVKFGSDHLFNLFEKMSFNPTWRRIDAEKFNTDDGNYIIDIDISKVENIQDLAHQLSELPGVIEHGIFIEKADKVLIGSTSEPKIIDLKRTQ